VNHGPEPLRGQLESADPVLARAAELVASVGPLAESRARMHRVRRLLDERRRSVGPVLLRPAVVVGVLLGLTAAAAATWGTLHIVRGERPQASSPSPVGAPVSPTPPRSQPVSRLEPREVPPAAPSSEAVRTDGRARSPSAASEAALVQGAVEALRRDRDPERASRLLEQYRKRNPDGSLGEEALALAVEAAMDRNDPRSSDLAREYLARYPQGRFRQVAQEALRRAAPR